MIDTLCVIGHPSSVGGADTELDHQIHCWRAMGIEVRLCPNGSIDEKLRAMWIQKRGCVYHEPSDWESLEGLHCISFCNGDFLKHLPEIRQHARSTTFVNCMSWNFDAEIDGQERGLIDFHLYQTQHSFERVSQKLKDLGTYRPMFFKPYFHADEFPYTDDRPQDKFRFGRISRDDGDKFGSRQLWIYETMTAPVLKEGQILGWGQNARKKFGRQPESYVNTLTPRRDDALLRNANLQQNPGDLVSKRRLLRAGRGTVSRGSQLAFSVRSSPRCFVAISAGLSRRVDSKSAIRSPDLGRWDRHNARRRLPTPDCNPS